MNIISKEPKLEDIILVELQEDYHKAVENLNNTDPSDENYEMLEDAVKDARGRYVEFYIKRKELNLNNVKFWAGLAVNGVQFLITVLMTLLGWDFEATNSMTSKLWPRVLNAMPLKMWSVNTNS